MARGGVLGWGGERERETDSFQDHPRSSKVRLDDGFQRQNPGPHFLTQFHPKGLPS